MPISLRVAFNSLVNHAACTSGRNILNFYSAMNQSLKVFKILSPEKGKGEFQKRTLDHVSHMASYNLSENPCSAEGRL